jgi:hypothetical protein
MAIAFVNQGFNGGSNATANFPLVITYSSTPGNTLVLFAVASTATSGVVVSVVDSNSTSWTRAATKANTIYGEMWYIFNSPAITSVTVTYTGGVLTGYDSYVSEYSGVNSVGAATTNLGSSNAPTITQNITAANNWIVAGDALNNGAAGQQTMSPGNIRQAAQVPARALSSAIGDNTSSSSGPVTATFHYTNSAAWASIALELLLPAVPSGGLPANSLMMVGCGK